MSHTYTAFSAIAAVVRANLSGWYLLLALLFFSLFMAGCAAGPVGISQDALLADGAVNGQLLPVLHKL